MIYFAHPMSANQLKVFSNDVDEEVKAGPLRQEDDGLGQKEDYVEELAKAEIVICRGADITEALIRHCRSIRWFHSVSAGVNKVPFDMLERRGIILTNSRGIHAKPVAEQAIGMMISFTRGLHANLLNQQAKKWERIYPLKELTGQTLCIIGSGTIGAEIARKAKAFDMKVIGVKRHPIPLSNYNQVFGIEQLQKAVAQGDFVIVLTPLTTDTYHLINAEVLSKMKPSAILLNFARGDVIDEEALVDALSLGKISGAGLDVFHEEPLPAESSLWMMSNVLISPHNGGWTSFHNARLVEIVLENYHAYRAGRPLPTLVNLKLGY